MQAKGHQAHVLWRFTGLYMASHPWMYAAPRSTLKSPICTVSMRPPSRVRASRTSGSTPRSRRYCAAARPAGPAPTMTTRALRRASLSRAYWLVNPHVGHGFRPPRIVRARCEPRLTLQIRCTRRNSDVQRHIQGSSSGQTTCWQNRQVTCSTSSSSLSKASVVRRVR